jgi:hypothetical protein
MEEHAKMKTALWVFAAILLGCSQSTPQYQGPLTIQGVSLGEREAELTTAGWKADPSGQTWRLKGESRSVITLDFSPDRRVCRISGHSLENAQGQTLAAFGTRITEAQKVLGTPDEWAKPDRPPGFGDPPARNQMIYRNLKLVVDNDPREPIVDHFILGESR